MRGKTIVKLSRFKDTSLNWPLCISFACTSAMLRFPPSSSSISSSSSSSSSFSLTSQMHKLCIKHWLNILCVE